MLLKLLNVSGAAAPTTVIKTATVAAAVAHAAPAELPPMIMWIRMLLLFLLSHLQS